jgi:hypothetical protein
MPQPFRWNIAKKEQLGRLVEMPQAEIYPDFFNELEDCCSRVIAFCDNSDLIFVGRSPESLFDYLSGLLAKTSWASRCSMLNVAFVDVVSSGSTFRNITDLLTQWHKEQGGAEKSLRRKLRYVGLTLREKTSPNTWRVSTRNGIDSIF